MDTPATWLDHLKLLAAQETVRLEAIGQAGLDELLARGLLRKDERPQQVGLEARYGDLQETHRHFLEARGCAERLQRRMAPRPRLAGLLPMGAPAQLGPEDPEVLQLLELLPRLKLQVRGVAGPEDIPYQLDRILNYLQVGSRDCLDRLADTDRELDLLQKEAPRGTLVEPGGYFTLTPAGAATLPEAPVFEAFEAVLQTAFGPLGRRGAMASHLREDPASLLAFLVERTAWGERPSTLIAEYENLLEAYERVATFAQFRPLRAKICFLVRLLRAARDEPKRAYLWCSREHLHGLLDRMQPLLPSSLTTSCWQLVYAADLFLADGGLAAEEAQADLRTNLYAAVQRLQANLLQDIRIADGQFVRLSLVLTHAARVRNFTPGILLDRFLRQAFETLMEAARAAPYDLGDRGTRLLFGTHLAHAAGFAKANLPGPLAAFALLRTRLRDEGPVRHIQTLLHAFATLERMERLGAPVNLDTYAGILARLGKRLNHHKVVSRAFRTDQALADDEAGLVSNLCARVCFQGLALPPGARHLPDVGLAGLYERRAPGLPPLLGAPFGTLMLT